MVCHQNSSRAILPQVAISDCLIQSVNKIIIQILLIVTKYAIPFLISIFPFQAMADRFQNEISKTMKSENKHTVYFVNF